MAQVFTYAATIFGHHYMTHHGVGILTLCDSYWSVVRTWRRKVTITAHH
jgi:hypothetical protein